ncbi:protoporphyrinogen oxidase [Paenibacillus chartarius]|uniref:Coproporphyrinogen III oxidase n=1 Tax=Paenibacillus chartarius TaxID=747481 RepID=A0ABV6DJ00_9BACL
MHEEHRGQSGANSGEHRVLIVGGGITGLSAAHYVRKEADKLGLNCRIVLTEGSDKLGGKIHTMYRDRFVIEKGPDSFLARKQPIIDLTKELGLEGELTGTNPNAKKTYILRRGRLHRLPQGLVLGIPTEVKPFIKTGLISPAGKARAALDLMLPRRSSNEDESLGDFLERRLGREVLDRIAEPLLAGIYAGDTHALSLRATFPQFHEIEKKHRSLILGMIAGKSTPAPAPGKQLPNAGKGTVFYTYKRGLQTLVAALTDELRQAGVELRTAAMVESLHKTEDDGGYEVRVSVRGAAPVTETYDSVILTTPGYATAELLSGLPAAAHLRDMAYISVANIILGFKAKEIKFQMDGTGFVIPRTEGTTITACTWTSIKWLHTAPEDSVVLRCYVGRSGEEGWRTLSDEELVMRVRADLQNILGITAVPEFTEVTRLLRSMPQYPVGHLEAIAELERQLDTYLPGVYATGAAFRGVGLPDCVGQAKETARRLVAHAVSRAAAPSA